MSAELIAELAKIIDRYADEFPDEPRVRVLQMAAWLVSKGVRARS